MKKKKISELEQGVKKEMSAICDKIKTEKSSLITLEKKQNMLLKKGAQDSPDYIQTSNKINTSENQIASLEASLAEFIFMSKQSINNIDFY